MGQHLSGVFEYPDQINTQINVEMVNIPIVIFGGKIQEDL